MKTTNIIEIELDFGYELTFLKGSPSTFLYYSNLTLAFNALKEALLVNEWDLKNFNYTAIYRSLREKDSYVKVFKSNGTAFFKIRISKRELNPKLISSRLLKRPV